MLQPDAATETVRQSIYACTGVPAAHLTPLRGGMIAEVYRVDLVDGRRAVAKVDRRTQPTLHIEGQMLGFLAAQTELPVPRLWHATPALLVMDWLPGASRFDARAEVHAAELLAALHAVQPMGAHAGQSGFPFDTLIGALPQPNPWSASWATFFAEARLLHLGRLAVDMQRMPVALLRRLEALCGRMDELIEEPTAPSLVHGDIWGGNLLADDGRIVGVLDPALYFGHAEVELAYIALFHSFGQAFFTRYQELRPLTPGFFTARMSVYQLYPLLSHVCHFGGHYMADTASTLAGLGF